MDPNVAEELAYDAAKERGASNTEAEAASELAYDTAKERESMKIDDVTMKALNDYLDKRGLHTQCALLLTAGELGVLHMALEVIQGLLSTVDPTDIPVGEFDTLRGKVALLLEKGGYEAPTI